MKWVQVYKQFVMLVVEQNKHRNAYACCYIFYVRLLFFLREMCIDLNIVLMYFVILSLKNVPERQLGLHQFIIYFSFMCVCVKVS